MPSRVHTVAGDRYAGAMPSEKPEPLTQAQKAQLETELAELEGPRRAAIDVGCMLRALWCDAAEHLRRRLRRPVLTARIDALR